MKFLMRMMLGLFFIGVGFANTEPTSGTFRSVHYTVCFTPGGNCTQQIVNVINSAKQRINIQAYGFTSAPIAKSLISAKQRGVKIFVLLDKSNVSSKYSIATTLKNQHIPFLIDSKPAIAHNKVMIIDAGTPSATVITGSFNFTSSAQKRNAENLIIIHDRHLAAIYTDNFNSRKLASKSVQSYCHTGHKCRNFQ